MKKEISVALIQADLVWEKVDENLSRLNEMVSRVSKGTDLILLPETFSTGFTMNAERYAEELDGSSVRWMKKVAGERGCVIAGSLIIKDQGGVYNRLFWVTPDGIGGTYDKRHLFRMGREDQHFVPGNRRPVFTLGGLRFLPQICYDLRFPVFSRNRGDYDVLFYVANWPAPRQMVWDALTRARAIENQTYLLAVSRVGVDGEGVDHVGGSCVYDPVGNAMGILDHQEGILTATLEPEKLHEFREKFPAWKDADRFTIEGVD